MASKKTTSNLRRRNFATVVYPDSAPDNWQQILADFIIPAFISPLHDSDFNPMGEAKKPHYHVILMFEGKKSEEQVREIFDAIGGVGLEVVESIRGYARYLCHLDNPEKAAYSVSEVIALSGANYEYTIGLVLDKYKAIREMIAFCSANQVMSYAALLEYASASNDTWFRVLCDNGSYVLMEFIKSKTWEYHSDTFMQTISDDALVSSVSE